jgi:hypothetical protein
MIVFWIGVWGIVWLASCRLLYDGLGPTTGVCVWLVFTLLQIFFVEALSVTRPAGFLRRLSESLGVTSAGLLGGMVGVLCVWSVLFFRGSWEGLLTGLGWLIGVLIFGVAYVLALRQGGQRKRDDALSGFLISVFVVSLAAYLLAKLSLISTEPDWLFRFPEVHDVRDLWGEAEWAGLLLLFWSVGAACMARFVRKIRLGGRGF